MENKKVFLVGVDQLVAEFCMANDIPVYYKESNGLVEAIEIDDHKEAQLLLTNEEVDRFNSSPIVKGAKRGVDMRSLVPMFLYIEKGTTVDAGHYNNGECASPLDICNGLGLSFIEGNILKYIMRSQFKDSLVNDLNKVKSYVASLYKLRTGHSIDSEEIGIDVIESLVDEYEVLENDYPDAEFIARLLVVSSTIFYTEEEDKLQSYVLLRMYIMISDFLTTKKNK